GAREQHGADPLGAQVAAVERRQLGRQSRRQRVGPGRVFERGEQQVVAPLHAERAGRRRGAHRPSPAASDSGSSTSSSSRPWPWTFPWASVTSDAVPPPPSESWSRKLSASRLGTSKRSTSPLQIAAKCAFTRSAVTSRAITS